MFRRIRNILGLSESSMFDICPYNDHHDTLNEYDARMREWSPWMNWGNFNWSEGWRYLPLMSHNWAFKGQSSVALMTCQSDSAKYWKKYVDGVALVFDYPPVAFGNYDRKLRDGLKIVMFLQPVWLDVVL